MTTYFIVINSPLRFFGKQACPSCTSHLSFKNAMIFLNHNNNLDQLYVRCDTKALTHFLLHKASVYDHWNSFLNLTTTFLMHQHQDVLQKAPKMLCVHLLWNIVWALLVMCKNACGLANQHTFQYYYLHITEQQ